VGVIGSRHLSEVAGTAEKQVSFLLRQTQTCMSASSRVTLPPKHSCTGRATAVSVVPGSSGMTRVHWHSGFRGKYCLF
jgi:hypothetical protein